MQAKNVTYLMEVKHVVFQQICEISLKLTSYVVVSQWFCNGRPNANVAQVNEAFAGQFLAVQKALGLDPEKTNVNGGAVAVGHPVGASGSRITAHLVHEIV